MDSRFELEFVYDLDWHQRYDPVRSGLDLYLGHDVISDDDPGDEAGELIAGRDCYGVTGRGVQ